MPGLESDPPYGAKVSFEYGQAATGWNAPSTAPWLELLITGVLGPHSNAHGPNEFLHILYAKKLTACVADVLTAHAAS